MVIVGSGFAGSLLARILAGMGYHVALVERHRHPRFALGESSTPLASLCLERISRRYGLHDLWQLATYGRWLEHHPDLRRGLKRGFTFLHHRPGGQPRWDPGARLLVAASPSDRVADTHWVREDVDHYFVRQAIAAGVDYRDRTTISGISRSRGGHLLAGKGPTGPLALEAAMVIDATGAGRCLGKFLGIPSSLRRTSTRSALLFAHFEGVRPLQEIVNRAPPGPYPDEAAAVHHLVEEGWIYSLRFDHGITSAGALLTPRGLAALGGDAVRSGPAPAWRRLLGRYPSLDRLFGDAAPVTPLRFAKRIQHRFARAAGEDWVMLPHAFAFVDPLFSTGIAWSLIAVERLARAFEAARRNGSTLPERAALAHYNDLLDREADQADRLVAGAYLSLHDFDLFAAHAMLYFASVSYAEIRQRLRPEGEEEGLVDGFLGVGDPALEPLAAAGLQRLRRITGRGKRVATGSDRERYAGWVRRSIVPRNLAGLADPARRNLYPVEFGTVIAAAPLLGLSPDEVAARLPRLRGEADG